MPEKIEMTVPQKFSGQRIDAVITEIIQESHPEITRSNLKTRDIALTVNGKLEKWNMKVKGGETITFELPDVKSLEAVPQDVAFGLIYSDNDIAVINKPYGLTVHPAKGHEDNTLVNGLLYSLKGKLSSIGGVERPGIVHRLDKDTAGLMIIALNDQAHHKLSEDFRDRKITKIYHAIVKGKLEGLGRIERPIGRSLKDRKKMSVREGGKVAITEFKVLEALNAHTYLEINLLTGRTHQIRVHLSSIQHPIAGDPLYSSHPHDYKMTGIALCAKKLEFIHPITGVPMKFEIPLPDEFQALYDRLKVK